ncbi:MAG: AI-2E family transporter [Gemmatimonadota bacterium]
MAEQRNAGAGTTAPDLEFVTKAALIVIALWGLGNLLWLARDVLFIAFFALLVASFLSIFVEPLHRLGLKRSIGAPAVLVVLLLVLAGLFALGWPTLSRQLSTIQQQLPAAVESAQRWLQSQLAAFGGSLGRDPAQMASEIATQFNSEFTGIIGGAVPLLNTAIGAVAGIILVLVSGLFIAVAPRSYMHGLIVLVPSSHRRRAGEVLPHAGEAMTQWMKGTALGMVIVAAMTTVGLLLIGVPAAIALGIIAGLLEFIPYLGPALSFVPVIAVTLAMSPEKALWVVGLYSIVQFTESNLLTPLVMKRMVKLPPALTLLFQTMMGVLFGFLGLVLAVPVLACAKTLVQELYVEGVADEH